MKRFLHNIFVFITLAVAASCQKEALETGMAAFVEYTVTVDDGLRTKAVSDDDAYVNQLVYEVWRTTSSDEEYVPSESLTLIYRGKVKMTSAGVTVPVKVIKNQNSRILFWAQDSTSRAYEASDLRNVRLNANNLKANKLNYTAFAGTDFLNWDNALQSRTIELERVVSQLNIATTDEGLKLGVATATDPKVVVIESSSVSVKGLSKTFDVASMEAGEDDGQTIVYEGAPLTDQVQDYGSYGNVDYTYVSMNYLGFVPKGGTNIDVGYRLVTNVGEIANTVLNVPVKPNYRTNIFGNLISQSEGYTVTLNNVWTSANAVDLEN